MSCKNMKKTGPWQIKLDHGNKLMYLKGLILLDIIFFLKQYI